MKQKTKNIIADVCRVVLGLTFVFSGFTKTVDPWGTALKITEYLNVYGFATLGGYRIGMAVVFCAAELLLGLMLTFKVKTRLTSVAAMLMMTFFLILTFLSATVLPVDDCGCFGEAVRLSPWGSFGKNVVLWALALVVWLNARRTMKIFPITVREWVVTAVFACLSVGLGIGCYRHLPLIDFLPYKKGVNLYEGIYGDSGEQSDVKLIYRDRTDGTYREFAVDDPTWHDAERWEFVRQAEVDTSEPDMILREFTIFNSDGDATEEIVGYGGRVYMISALKLDDIKPRCAERLARVVERAAEQNALVVCLTSSPISEGEEITFGTAAPVPVYNVDATTMIAMLRARVGLVVLDKGVIADKRNCRDAERRERY